MLIPELFDLQMHHIHCNTVDESMELWKEIKDATGCYTGSESDFRWQHKHTGGGVTYRVEMQSGYLEDWGWDNRRYFEAHGHKIMEFNEALSSPDLGDIVSNEAVDINGLFYSCEVTV